MGKDGGGGDGCYETVERRTVTVEPEKVLIIMVENGESYSDYRDWPIAFSTESRVQLQKRIDAANEELSKLHQEAQDYSAKIDYMRGWKDHAAGQRYFAATRKYGIAERGGYSQSRYRLFLAEVGKGKV